MLNRIVDRYLTAKALVDPATTVPAFRSLIEQYVANEKKAKSELDEIDKTLKLVESGHPPVGLDSLSLSSELYREARSLAKFWPIQKMGHELFLGILQTYHLTPKVRRSVEGCSRFFSKTRFNFNPKAPRGISFDLARVYVKKAPYDAYLKICGELNKALAVAQAAVTEGKSIANPEVAEKVRVPAGSFVLVNTGGFADSVMDTVAKVVEKSEKALRGIGLGKVCYGDIHVTNTIGKQTVAAFYQIQSDEMFVRANIKYNMETIHVVCHELAHRMQFQFLKSRDRELRDIYNSIKNQSRVSEIPDDMLPKPGDKATHKGKTFVVTAVRPFTDKVTMLEEGVVGTMYSTSVRGWLSMANVDVTSSPHFKGFITKYAGKDYIENFAEMVAFYAMGKLPEHYVEMLKTVL